MSDLSLCGNNVTICRLMNQNDANIYGNVHGGVILQMIEEAGLIVSTRHCNFHKSDDIDNNQVAAAALARVERTDFLQPMYVGEVAHLHARITYTSSHSLEVKVTVQAENILKGGVRLTNKATLWYVPKLADGKTGTVKPLTKLTSEEQQAGKERYEWQKKMRSSPISPMFDDWAVSLENTNQSGDRHTASNSLTTLVHFVNSTDCHMNGNLPGGYAMKIMDEAAGICAARHCHTPCVTASMDATNFYKAISKGSIINVRGRVIYTSRKSLIVQVVIVVEMSEILEEGKLSSDGYVGCSAFFTYVSLDKNGKTLPVPPLQITNKDEQDRYEEGEKMYLRQKKVRSKSITAIPSITVTQQQPAPAKSSMDSNVHNYTPIHKRRRLELAICGITPSTSSVTQQQKSPPTNTQINIGNIKQECLQLAPYVTPSTSSVTQQQKSPPTNTQTNIANIKQECLQLAPYETPSSMDLITFNCTPPSHSKQNGKVPITFSSSFGIAVPPPKEPSITAQSKIPPGVPLFSNEFIANDPYAEVSSICSKRGKRKFVHDDFVYVFDLQSKKDPTVTFWRCERKNACKGRIHVQNGQFLKMINWHSHGPSSVAVAVAEVKSILKRKADQPMQPSQLVKECMTNVSSDLQELLPKTTSMRQLVRRARNKIDSKSGEEPISGLDLLRLGQTTTTT